MWKLGMWKLGMWQEYSVSSQMDKLNKFLFDAFRSDYPLRNVKVIGSHKLVILKAGGKTGGTSVFRGYFEPVLCEHFYPLKTNYVKTFGGNKIPQGCLEYLRDRGIYYNLGTQSNNSFDDFKDFTFAVLLRNPTQRAPSSYYWMMRNKKKSQFPFSKFLRDAHRISHFGKGLGAHHWKAQTSIMLESNVPRFDIIICTHTLHDNFNDLINILNTKQSALSRLPTLPQKHHQNKNEKKWKKVVDLNLSSYHYFSEVCFNSIYAFDCRLVPCWVVIHTHGCSRIRNCTFN